MTTRLIKNIVIGAVVIFIIALFGLVTSSGDMSGLWLVLGILIVFIGIIGYFFNQFLMTKSQGTPASTTASATATTTPEWTSKDTREQIKVWIAVIGIPAGLYLFFVMLLPNVGSFMRHMVYIENWGDAFHGLAGLVKFVWYAFCVGILCCIAFWWYNGRPGYVPEKKTK